MQNYQVTASQAWEALPQLIALLQDSVDNGGSVGFLPPLDLAEAQAYWEKRLRAVEAGETFLFIVPQDGIIVGTVQLALEMRSNGNHRGEVQKLLVHTAYRRRGIAKQLMQVLEAAAIEMQRKLLVLDTRQGDPSEILYQSMGYQIAGVIPLYAKNGDGGIDPTVLYYKILDN